MALDPTRMLSQYALNSWQQRDGLSSPHVWSIAQSADGYLWLGTNGGLVRFDGRRFATCPSPAGETAPPLVTSTIAARGGGVWVGTNTGSLTRVQADCRRESIPLPWAERTVITALLEDADDALWVATQRGLLRRSGGLWERVGASEGLPAAQILALYADRGGTVWIGTASGLARWDRGASRPAAVAGIEGAVTSVVADARGTVWISDRSRGLLRVEAQTGRVVVARPSHPVPDAARVAVDAEGNLWIGTTASGLLRQTPAALSQDLGYDVARRGDGLPNDSVYALFIDREAGLWVGTQNGLARLRDTGAVPFGRTEGLPDDVVQQLTTAPDGSVWVGTPHGLGRWLDGRWRVFGTRDGLPAAGVSSVAIDTRGRPWVATTGGVARYDGRRFVPVPGLGGARAARIVAMAADDTGAMWLCDLGAGALRWRGGRVETVDALTSLATDLPISVHVDRQSRVWFGTVGGHVVRVLNGVARTFGVADGVPVGTVNHFHEDSAGRLWVATGAGLALLRDERPGRGSPFAALDPAAIPGVDRTLQIADDGLGTLWIAGRTSIVGVDRASVLAAMDGRGSIRVIRAFDGSSGLRGAPSRLAYSADNLATDGSLWFATSEGVVRFDPSRAPPPRPAPTVVLERVSVRGRPIPVDSPGTLAPAPGDVRFEFTATSLTEAHRNRFRYRLVGFDDGWTATDDRREVTYTNLGPGRYRFIVIAANSEGVWNATGAAWAFEIAPALHERWSVRILAAAMFALAIAGVSWVWQRRRMRRAADRLEAEAALLRRVTESIPQQVWSATPDGRVDYCNHRVLEYTGEIGSARLGWPDALHPDDDAATRHAWQSSLAAGQPFEAEFRIRRFDGDYRWFLTRALPLRDASGRIVQWFGTSTDIEDRRRLERRLREAEKMEAVGTLAAGVAHDFNNILGAILGYGELALEAAAAGTPSRRYAENVATAALRGKSLVEQILTYSRGTATRRVPVRIEEVVREVLDLLRATLPAGIELDVDLQARDAHVMADATHLHQAASNLCTNAVQAMPQGGRLRVALDVVRIARELALRDAVLSPGEFAHLTVADTGTGMDPATVARMFEPFFTTKDVRRGTGLGLSLVHAIVHEARGGIDVHSRPGSGTSIELFWPLIDAGLLPPASVAAPERLPRGDGEAVLVVDDDPALRSVAEEMLAMLGYVATSVGSGSAALERVTSAPDTVDVVVTDEVMPGMSGRELIAALLEVRADLPAILLSGDGSEALERDARAAGARAVLRKPLQLHELAAAVAAALPP
jgi:PAS domain S-box-containing protein